MGYIAEDQGRVNIDKVGKVAGPAVRLFYYDPVHTVWHGSVIIACYTSLFGNQAPVLNHKTPLVEEATDVVGEIIVVHAEWSVVRFRISTVLESQATSLEYTIGLAGDPSVSPGGEIHLPSETEEWHVAAFSCDDQRQRDKTGTAAWTRMRMLHETNPLHVCLGLGDQLYNDNVWHAPGMEAWPKIKDKQVMRTTPLTAEQKQAIEDFYFFAYVRWLAFHPLKQHLSGIPMMTTWDDHDIFDGWGSYPPHLQACPAFSSVYKVARKMYLAFQLHTSKQSYRNDGYFSSQGDPGLTWMTQLGPKLAVVGVDTRSSRSRSQILPQGLMPLLMKRVACLSSSVEHLIFISGVPFQYVDVGILEKVLAAGGGQSFLYKTGLMNSLMNDFGEPELLDDILDHWGSSRHTDERGKVLNELRNAAEKRKVRITLLSGDVHLACYGFTSSTEDYRDLPTDPGFMPQIVTSAIAYDPVGAAAVMSLDKIAGNGTGEVYEEPPRIWAGMGQPFKERKPGNSIRFANRNNFLEMQVAEDQNMPGVSILRCTFHIRYNTEASDEPDLDPHILDIPPLLKTKNQALVARIQEDLEAFLPGRGTILRKIPCCGFCFSCCGL